MEIVSTKIVNGKKMYLIDDTSNKLFANNGENVNPYYVPIQEINSSDNTKTKLTPKQELSKKEIQQLKTSPTAVQNIRDREKFEKEERLRKSEQAYQKRIKTGIQSSQDLADEIGAIGDKISLQNIPKIGQYIPNILDVTGGIGSMASGLGQIPLNLENRNYGQALFNLTTPLTVGALAGIGNPTTGQFINNLVNPLVGIGDLTKSGLREGVDLVHPIGRQLRKINKEGILQGLSEQEIKKRQLQEVGITSLQRKGYFPGASEIFSEYITPYGYDNAIKRILEIPKKIIKGDKNIKKLNDDISFIIPDGTNLSKPRYDSWRLYSGMPQKYNTFRIAETSPLNHPSYTQEQLNNLEKFSLNGENALLMNLSSEYDYLRYDWSDEDLLNNIDHLKKELNSINNLQQKEIDFSDSDFYSTNVMGGYNRRFFDNKMEYNDIWDLDLGGLKVDRFFGKPFLSHGQLDYSFEPAKNEINRILSKASKINSNIKYPKYYNVGVDYNLPNNFNPIIKNKNYK